MGGTGGRECRGGEFSWWGLALGNVEGAAVAIGNLTRHYIVIRSGAKGGGKKRGCGGDGAGWLGVCRGREESI